MTLQDCIALMPEILLYVIPGFVGLQAFKCAIIENKEYQHTLISSCAISYIGVAIVRQFLIPLSFWAEVIWTCVACSGGGFVIGRILHSHWCQELLTEHFHMRLSSATISSSINWEKANAALVYLKSTSDYFVGSVQTVGDNDGDGWIAIGYPTYYNEDGQILWDYQNDDNAVVLIQLDEIQSLRIVNDT